MIRDDHEGTISVGRRDRRRRRDREVQGFPVVVPEPFRDPLRRDELQPVVVRRQGERSSMRADGPDRFPKDRSGHVPLREPLRQLRRGSLEALHP